MRIVANVLRQIFGLFVDDGIYALLIVGWVAVCGTVIPRLPLDELAKGPVLFIGLAVILWANVRRSARDARRRLDR